MIGSVAPKPHCANYYTHSWTTQTESGPIEPATQGAKKSMSISRFRIGYFASAPTVRFLQAMEGLCLLSATQRRKIAAAVFGEIGPLVGSRDIEELGRAARCAQDQRWRLIYRGVGEATDHRFHSTAIAEQWMLASLVLLRDASPLEEILAEKRCSVVETFIRDNLPSDCFDVVQLRAPAMRQPDQSHLAKAA
jgi:hypothetical protein